MKLYIETPRGHRRIVISRPRPVAHWHFEQCTITLGGGLYANDIEPLLDVAIEFDLSPTLADALDRVLP